MAATKINKKTTTKKEELTPFEKQLLETVKKINEYKLSCEANVVSIIYKNPQILHETNLKTEELSSNAWKVFHEIAKDIVLTEGKNVLDIVTVNIYLERHPKLRQKFEEYNGIDLIESSAQYIEVDNFDGYLQDLRRWNAILKLAKRGFNVADRLSDFASMTAEEIYEEYEALLNQTFANIDNTITSYNAFEGMKEFIDELDNGAKLGIPYSCSDILNRELGGIHRGQIVGIGASSGTGKSTLACNYLLGSALKYNLKVVYIINEDDVTKLKIECLIWYINNVLKEPFSKYELRNGHYAEEQKELLYKAAEWFQTQKDNRNITVIPLETYSASKVIKLLKTYANLGADIIVLDTLKESYDARGQETWKSIMNDCLDYYNVIKNTNAAMMITYQLTKNRSRFLSSSDVGVSKGILDVFSANCFFRRPLPDEYEGEKNELQCYRVHKKSKIPFKLKKGEHYMICFISKNRSGNAGIQIVSKANFSTNEYEDLGYCNVNQNDW